MGKSLVVSVACLAGFGCIEPNRTLIDASVADGVASDVAPDADQPDAGPDIAPDLDTPEVTAKECEVSADCDGLAGDSACTEWRCNNLRCELTNKPDGGSCDDDVCTLGDACEAGVCKPGSDKDCSALGVSTECTEVGCGPTGECFRRHREQGATCNAGGSLPVGRCVAGGFVPPDACDGSGVCVDTAVGAPGTPNTISATGDWLLVYSDFETLATLSTTRSVVRVGADNNTVTFKNIKNFGQGVLGAFTSAYYCADVTGRIALGLGGTEFRGEHVYGQIAVLKSPNLNGVGLLMPVGSNQPQTVEGTYNIVQTSLENGASTPTTWRGQVVFEAGCVVSWTISTGPGDGAGWAFQRTDGPCLGKVTDVVGEESLVEMSVDALSLGGDGTSKRFHYRGMIGPHNDMLLMTTESPSGNPAQPTLNHGVVLMVRDTARGTFEPSDLVGPWNYSFFGRIPGGEVDSIRSESGTLEWGAAGEVMPAELRSGSLTTKTLTGGWYAFDEVHRQISQRLLLDTPDYQAGYLAPSNRFIIGWTVAEPTSPENPAVFADDSPTMGSLVFLLRPEVIEE